MSDWIKQLSHKLQQLPLETSIGALRVKVLKFQYVPPGPDWQVASHKHSSYEFHFITSGKGYVQMGEAQFIVEKGMLFLTGPEITHSQITDRHDPMAELCLQCQITLQNTGTDVEIQEAQQLLKILNTPVYHGVKDEYGAIPMFLQCARESSEQLVGYFSAIQNHVANLIVCSARALASHQVKALYEVPLKERGYEIVQESILFLEDNYQRQITLEHVAEFVHFSPRHLGRMFKMVTGKTINQFLTDIRMFRAENLLKETDYSLEHIANEIGFANGSYLSLLFKRIHGCSPSEYRQACQPVERVNTMNVKRSDFMAKQKQSV